MSSATKKKARCTSAGRSLSPMLGRGPSLTARVSVRRPADKRAKYSSRCGSISKCQFVLGVVSFADSPAKSMVVVARKLSQPLTTLFLLKKIIRYESGLIFITFAAFLQRPTVRCKVSTTLPVCTVMTPGPMSIALHVSLNFITKNFMFHFSVCRLAIFLNHP